MKKIYLILIIIIFSLCFEVRALGSTSSIECDANSIPKNEIVKCTVKVNVKSGSLYGFYADIKLNENTELLSSSCEDNWQGGITNNKIGVYTSNPIENKSATICTLTIKDIGATSNIGFSLENVKYTDEGYNTVNEDNILKTDITVKEKNTSDNKDDKENGSTKNPETGDFLPVASLVFAICFCFFCFRKINAKFYKI